MTRLGANRQRYSREVETAPSRFSHLTAYHLWARRADAYAEANGWND